MSEAIRKIFNALNNLRAASSPIVKAINLAEEKSYKIWNEKESLEKNIESQLLYLIKSSREKTGVVSYGGYQAVSLTSSGLHISGDPGDKIRILSSKLKISKDKKHIRSYGIESYYNNDGKCNIKMPISYFQEDMQKKVIECIDRVSKMIDIKTKKYVRGNVYFMPRQYGVFITGEKHKNNNKFYSFDHLKTLSSKNSAIKRENIEEVQEAVDFILDMEKICFKKMRSDLRESRNILETIKKYNTPFRMFDKLKRKNI